MYIIMEVYKCREYINIEILNKIIRSALVDELSIIHLKKLRKRAEKTGFHTLTFTSKEKLDKQPCGRLYPKDNTPSLQTVKKNIRKALCFENYLDFDIKSCFPCILNKLLNDFNFTSSTLNDYITQGKIDFDKSKLRVMLNASEWNTEDKVEMNAFIEINDKVKKLVNLPFYKKYKALGEAKNESNPIGTAISFILQDAERQIMTVVVEILRNHNYETGTLIHDGILIKTGCIKPEVIEGVKIEIKNKLDFDVNFSIKPMDYDEEELFTTETKVAREIPFYETMKPEFEKTNFVLLNPIQVLEIEDNGTLTQRSIKDFHNRYSFDNYCKVWDEEKEIYVKKPFTKVWLADEGNIRNYKKIDFVPPPMVCEETTYNTWNGIEMEKYKEILEPSDEYNLLLDHIKMLFNYDEKLVDYFLKYLAHIVQFPAKLTGIAFVIRGKEGAGKSTIMEIINKLIGDELYYYTGDADQHLFSRFSNGRVDKLVVNIDDNDLKSLFQHISKLKTAITAPKLNQETKGFSPIVKNNFNRFIFTTNSINPIVIDDNDRRYVIIDSNNEKKGNTPYFKNIYSVINNKNAMLGLYNYLMSLDCESVDWYNDRPITEYYKEVASIYRSPIIDYLEHMATSPTYFIEKERSILSKDFFKNYMDWYGKDTNMNTKKFGLIIKEIIGDNILTTEGSAFWKQRKTKGIYYNINKKLLFEWLRNNNYTEVQEIESDDECKIE